MNDFVDQEKQDGVRFNPAMMESRKGKRFFHILYENIMLDRSCKTKLAKGFRKNNPEFYGAWLASLQARRIMLRNMHMVNSAEHSSEKRDLQKIDSDCRDFWDYSLYMKQNAIMNEFIDKLNDRSERSEFRSNSYSKDGAKSTMLFFFVTNVRNLLMKTNQTMYDNGKLGDQIDNVVSVANECRDKVEDSIQQKSRDKDKPLPLDGCRSHTYWWRKKDHEALLDYNLQVIQEESKEQEYLERLKKQDAGEAGRDDDPDSVNLLPFTPNMPA